MMWFYINLKLAINSYNFTFKVRIEEQMSGGGVVAELKQVFTYCEEFDLTVSCVLSKDNQTN